MPRFFTRIRGDIWGGITAALVSIPGNIAYGIIVFAPLGPDYVPVGVTAGFIGLALANIGAGLLGSNRVLITTPEPVSALTLAATLVVVLDTVDEIDPGHTASVAPTFLFFIVFASGLLQVLFGLLKLGNLAKYIPYPVTAGLLNGIAVLLAVQQIRPMLGLPSETALTDFDSIATHFQILTFLVGMWTLTIIFYGRLLTTRIPPIILAMLIGTASYYMLSFLGYREFLCGLVGPISGGFPVPQYGEKFRHLVESPTLLDDVVQLAPLVVALAIAITIKTLAVTVALDGVSQVRSDANRELVGQGFGNMLAGIFGGLTSTANQSVSLTNYEAGGRTHLSKIFTGVAAFAVLAWLGPIVALFPRVILAAVLVSVALKLIDPWSLNLLSRFASDFRQWKHVIEDLLVVLTVTVSMVVFGIFEGLAVGLLISFLLFFYRASRNILRRKYTAREHRSSVDRTDNEVALLERYGNKILVLELEGSIFFGTADHIASLADPERLTDRDILILDFRRVSDVDGTGARVLLQLKKIYEALGKSLLLSGIDSPKSYNIFLFASGTFEAMRSDSVFLHVDDALERAEDQLLDKFLNRDRYAVELSLGALDVLRDMRIEERELFQSYCTRMTYRDGEVLFQQGDPGDWILIIRQGRVEVYVNFGDPEKTARIARFRPGTVLGEISVLDENPRMVTAVAKGHVSGLLLSKVKLGELRRECPDIALKFLVGIVREMAKRVRVVNAATTALRL
ncbi:MAG: cyclic nucleotide-binding domain-containing protein [Chromatiaceae bacterium]|nr:cyclic nucleotide-binding domain-containing protein [Chromatiaceae bacterium]